MRLHCRGDQPGFRPGSRPTFFASPKTGLCPFFGNSLLNQKVKEFIVVVLSLIKSSTYAKNGQSPAKKDRQKKATPTVPPRCAGSPRRWCPERGAAKLATLRCAALKQTPHLFPLRAPTSRRYTDGDPNCNGHFKSNCNCNCKHPCGIRHHP